MECFDKIVYGFQPLIIFEKRSILDVCQGSEYASGKRLFLCNILCLPFYIKQCFR